MKAPADTLLFKYICPTLEEFVSSEIAIETMEATTVYNGDEPLSKDIWAADTYRLLIRRYRNYEVANYNVDDFLDLLWERIEIHAPNYYERKSRYQQLLNMSDSELLSNGRTISNYVEHTDTRVDGDPLEKPLPNVSNQSATQSYGDYSGRLRSQIRNAQETLIDDYLNKFKKLFIRATTMSNYQ